MSDVLMPRLSDSMEEGTIVRWLKADGDEVRRGEEIVEIETDKAIMAYESDFSGVLAIAVTEGSSVEVGAVIAQVRDGAAVPEQPASAVTARAAPPIAATSAGASVNGRAKASPLARRAAERLGVDLVAVVGSGPYGRILKADVVVAAQTRPAAALPATVYATGGVRELSMTQRLIARRMSESRNAVPEFALEVDVDMSKVIALRAEFKRMAEVDPCPSINDAIIKACAVALRRHPRANGSFAGDHFVIHDDVNIAFAVAAEDALVVPVIRDADRKSVGVIASESRDLIERARARTVAPSDLEGGTFTVSNLGMFGIDRFEGIINAPQAAILCVGAIRERPLARDGEVVIAPLATLTLASDHRILYGAHAAGFLMEIRSLLEAPLRMLL